MHTLHLLFRVYSASQGGYIVCVRDLNPKGFPCSLDPTAKEDWSDNFIWYLIRPHDLPMEEEPEQRDENQEEEEEEAKGKEEEEEEDLTVPPFPRSDRTPGCMVEFAGYCSTSDFSDASFWLLEVLTMAVRWEGVCAAEPLLTS